MAHRNIDSVSKKIKQEKEKTISNAFSDVKPSGGIKGFVLKPRIKKQYIKKQHLQKLTSAYLMMLMIFQSLAGVFMWMPKGNEAKAASNIYDSFTDNTGVLLENHTSDTGNIWTKNSAVSDGSSVIANNRIYENTNVHVVYNSNWSPASADYDVAADVYIASMDNVSGQKVGVGGRAGTSAFTGYYALLAQDIPSGNIIRLYRGGERNSFRVLLSNYKCGTNSSSEVKYERNEH